MELTQETKKKFLQVKEDATLLLASINSVFSTLTLKRFEIECLYYLSILIDDILLERIDTKRHSEEIVIMARLIELELILGASKSKDIKMLIEKMKQISV